jgi:ribosomal protein L11 methyltransferase
MDETTMHTRWQLEVPQSLEDALSDWLMTNGASAMYRDANPPNDFFAYFPPNAAVPDLASLSAFDGVSLLKSEIFDDEDWLEKSREGFGPIEAGCSFYIRPIWDQSAPTEGRMAIVVNPGLAFGTGGHETTRLCMGLLEDLAQLSPNGRLEGPILDIGAGTGILAFSAHLLGAQDIAAIDIDPDCGPAMEEFIQMNTAVARHPAPFAPFIGTLEDLRPKKEYRLILANILLETIQELLPQMLQRLGPNGHLVASGILAERQDEALLLLTIHGLKPIKVAAEGEWVAILARRYS